MIVQHTVSLTAGVQVVALGKGDQGFHHPAQLLGLDFRGADFAVDQQGLSEIIQQGLTVRRRTREFPAGIAMPHFAASFSIPDISCRRNRPSCRSQGPCPQEHP